MNPLTIPTPCSDAACLCLGKIKRCGRCALIAAAKARQAPAAAAPQKQTPRPA